MARQRATCLSARWRSRHRRRANASSRRPETVRRQVGGRGRALRAALADNDNDDSIVSEAESTADGAAASSRPRRSPPPRRRLASDAAQPQPDAAAAGAAVRRKRWRGWAAQLRIETNVPRDRLYASPYVYASDGDGQCGRPARAAPRATAPWRLTVPKMTLGSIRRALGRSRPPTAPYQLAARLAHGRAAAVAVPRARGFGRVPSGPGWSHFREGSVAGTARGRRRRRATRPRGGRAGRVMVLSGAAVAAAHEPRGPGRQVLRASHRENARALAEIRGWAGANAARCCHRAEINQ